VLVLGMGLASCATPASKPEPSQSVATTTTLPTLTVPSTTSPEQRVVPTNHDAELTISETNVSVGEQVTIAGTGCIPGHWGSAILVQGPDAPAVFNTTLGLYDGEEDFNTNSGNNAGGVAAADGRWTMTVTVPMVAPGSAMLTGSCAPSEGDSAYLDDFLYPTVAVVVTTSFRLAVQPGTTAAPGTALVVEPVGGNCPGVSGPEVYLYSGSHIQLAYGSLTAGGAASAWQATLVIPKGLAPGQYQLEADCIYSRGLVLGSYAPTIIFVS